MITTSVVSGLPKKEILEKAESFNADLIVVGSQGQGAFSRLLLGSVSPVFSNTRKMLSNDWKRQERIVNYG
ncbi:universal stress protein [Zunongwangia sp. H14]|uniref:universal stress protein n=1 Tax=Zunongwangia sp. H14 TaxID=3240792 RepID=UPI0035637D95